MTPMMSGDDMKQGEEHNGASRRWIRKSEMRVAHVYSRSM